MSSAEHSQLHFRSNPANNQCVLRHTTKRDSLTCYEHVDGKKNGALGLATEGAVRVEAGYYPKNYRSGMTQVGSSFQTLQK